MTDPSSRYVVGVDVGGTFTDVFFLNEASGRCHVAKVPSTLGNQSQGFIEGIKAHVAELGSLVLPTTGARGDGSACAR